MYNDALWYLCKYVYFDPHQNALSNFSPLSMHQLSVHITDFVHALDISQGSIEIK